MAALVMECDEIAGYMDLPDMCFLCLAMLAMS
jgi:hypothetical protein